MRFWYVNVIRVGDLNELNNVFFPSGRFFQWYMIGLISRMPELSLTNMQMLVGVVAFQVLKVMDLTDHRALGVLLVGYFFQGKQPATLDCGTRY
jgi:hypothetical protein